MTFIQADANNPVSMGTITCKNSDVSSIGMQLAKSHIFAAWTVRSICWDGCMPLVP